MRWRETLPPAFQEASGVPCSPGRKKLAGVKGPGFPRGLLSSPPLAPTPGDTLSCFLACHPIRPRPDEKVTRGGQTGLRLGDERASELARFRANADPDVTPPLSGQGPHLLTTSTRWRCWSASQRPAGPEGPGEPDLDPKHPGWLPRIPPRNGGDTRRIPPRPGRRIPRRCAACSRPAV
ncbi:unnamed protein product [Rangifer tarandus platyrhynchus]|uniref:Uncharacterized protein n=2 Tax=Rangifer tarandus platyrhynchus TaxID=3082113 RepID=A0ACB0EUD9_RANTA|nr:unnamed protein product [Rangifer tarandus platyrhynchus]CAI9704049.1 unnamed protein product [Rangifer tarandus platyrhynchus]